MYNIYYNEYNFHLPYLPIFVSGIKFPEVLVSTVMMQMVIHSIQTAISMYVMYIHFDNPYLGDHFPTVTLLLLIGMEGMIFGKSTN